MALGPGKYDELCTEIRAKANATAAVVIIVAGEHGHGFSVQSEDQKVLASLPAILRSMADQIEGDMPGNGRN